MIVILLPNNQRQCRTLHIQKDVLPLAARPITPPCLHACSRARVHAPPVREFFIDNLLVRIHFIIVMIWWTGLAPCPHVRTPAGRNDRVPPLPARRPVEMQPCDCITVRLS